MSTHPDLNLDNLEEPWASTSPYVLTSPRSLRACEAHSVKVGQLSWFACNGFDLRFAPFPPPQPVDLLPRSIDDFRRIYSPLGYDHAAVYGEYTRFESRRQGLFD